MIVPSSSFRPTVFAVGLFLLTWGTGCESRKPEAETSAAERNVVTDPLTIRAEPGLLQRLRIEEPVWAEVGTQVTVTAHVSVDETRVTRVGSPVMGRVVELSMGVGQDVKRGQELAALHSTALSDAQLAFLRGLSRKQIDERAVERAKTLLEAGVIGSVEMHRRQAEFSQSTAEFDAARDQLSLLGMSPDAISRLEQTRQIDSLSRVVAGITGTVLDRKVTLGQVVQASESLCDIADLSQVWVVADVPEQNAGKLSVGQPVQVRVSALPDRVLVGPLTFVSATANPVTHTVQVRLEVPNTDRTLKPAMLATLQFDNHLEKRMVIPLAAVVREENSEHVFVQKDTNTFTLRKVTLGHEARDNRVAIEGLREGEKVVTDGAFHLNNERRRRALKGNEGA